MALPSGYKRVEYLKSDGNQEINMGFKAGSNTRIEAKFRITYGSSWQEIFGSYDSNAYFSLWSNGTRLDAYYYNTSKIVYDPGTDIELVVDNNVWTINGTALTFTAATFQASTDSYLFGIPNGGNYVNAPMELEYFRAYQNGILIRDYIPCVTASNEAGLWDDVNSVFYGNVGSGAFTAGPEVVQKGNNALIDGVARNIKSGRVLIGGTGYKIKKGRTLIDGVGYDVSFGPGMVTLTIRYKNSQAIASCRIYIDGVKYATSSLTNEVLVAPGTTLRFTPDNSWNDVYLDGVRVGKRYEDGTVGYITTAEKDLDVYCEHKYVDFGTGALFDGGKITITTLS